MIPTAIGFEAQCADCHGFARLTLRAAGATNLLGLPGVMESTYPPVPRPQEDDPVIRLSVFYPATEGATFDHDYYRDKHVPLCVRTWGVTDAEIDKGVDGPYVAAVHLRFGSAEELQKAMANPGTAEILADVANYTSIAPVLQTSEVVG